MMKQISLDSLGGALPPLQAEIEKSVNLLPVHNHIHKNPEQNKKFGHE
ncbi:hypothetical protein [Neobacillus mesonae]|nr:hypothetical protein [Neobacillus mesonae]MCM3570445.1 hypothetical protein [Neobacillus mesonae]